MFIIPFLYFVTHLLQYLTTIGLYNPSRYPRTRLRYLTTIGYGPRSRLNQSVDKRFSNIRSYILYITTTTSGSAELNNLNNHNTLQITDTTVLLLLRLSQTEQPEPHHTTYNGHYRTTTTIQDTNDKSPNIDTTNTNDKLKQCPE